jgi:hypothetical protein
MTFSPGFPHQPGLKTPFSPGWLGEPGLKVPARANQKPGKKGFSPGWSHQPGLKGVKAYLNLDDEGEGQGMDIEMFAGGQTNNDPELQTNTSGEVYICIEPLVIQI